MAEQDGGMVGEIDAGLTLSRDIRFEDPLCQKPICAKSGRPFVWLEDDADHDCNQASLSPSWEASEVKILRRGSCNQAGGSSEGGLSLSPSSFLSCRSRSRWSHSKPFFCPPPSSPSHHRVHPIVSHHVLVQLYLVHNHHLHHLLNHQPSYHLDHLEYHYDHHCFESNAFLIRCSSPSFSMLWGRWVL